MSALSPSATAATSARKATRQPSFRIRHLRWPVYSAFMEVRKRLLWFQRRIFSSSFLMIFYGSSILILKQIKIDPGVKNNLCSKGQLIGIKLNAK